MKNNGNICMEARMGAIRKELHTLTDVCSVVYVSLCFLIPLTQHAVADFAQIIFYKAVSFIYED